MRMVRWFLIVVAVLSVVGVSPDEAVVTAGFFGLDWSVAKGEF